MRTGPGATAPRQQQQQQQHEQPGGADLVGGEKGDSSQIAAPRPADGDTQMGCSGLAPPSRSPGRRLRAALAQLPRALCAAAPPTPPPPLPDPARGRRRQCCRAQGVMGHWGRAPATFGHVPGGGLRTWRDGSAEEHGASRESDRRFRLLALKGEEGVAFGCSRDPVCNSIGQREQRRWSRTRGEEHGGLPVGGKATFYEPLAARHQG